MHRKDHWERVYTTKGEARRQLVRVPATQPHNFPSVFNNLQTRAISLSNSPPLD